MIEASVTSKGQVTIPKKVRESLHNSAGDKIGFIISDKGELTIRPISKSADEFLAFFHLKKMKTFSIDEMNRKLHNSFNERKV